MTRPGERGAIRKAGGSHIPVALVYPNAYRVGMANLGYQTVYRCLNDHPRFSAERFFYPDPSICTGGHGMGLRSEESGRPLADFPIIAFSAPFENDYPAVPGALQAAGIAALQSDRGGEAPLVIAGGVSVSMNPEPLAPFLDLAFIGEMDDSMESRGLLSALADAFSASPQPLRDRRDFLRELCDVPGVFVPSAYTYDFDDSGLIREIRPEAGFPERVRAVKQRSRHAVAPVSVLFTEGAEFGGSLLIETNRGCSRGCRFCATGWIHRPVRYAGFDRFRKEVDQAIGAGRTIGLVGSDLAGHPELEEILAHIVSQGGTFSLSSIRPEGLTPSIVKLLAKSGQRTATLAPEAASLRMKKVIGKEIPSERFFELVEELVRAGIPNVRFYFMVGLPGETDDDAWAITDFVLKSREIFVDASRPRKRIGTMAVQLNAFVPKPWTPFQWVPMASQGVLRQRLHIVQDRLRKVPNLTVRVESVREATVQGLISRGDRKMYPCLLLAAGQGGRWSGVMKRTAVDLEFYLYRERGKDEIFPWDTIDHGLTKESLRRAFARAIPESAA